MILDDTKPLQLVLTGCQGFRIQSQNDDDSNSPRLGTLCSVIDRYL